MTAIFAECRRVLRDDGVLTVMFTHKRAEAWDTLGMGLLQAGFTHRDLLAGQHRVRALVCTRRTRTRPPRPSCWYAASATTATTARRSTSRTSSTTSGRRRATRPTRFQHDGIDGVDLLLSTYGPTLSVISQNWPVYSSTPDDDGRDQLLRPEDALDAGPRGNRRPAPVTPRRQGREGRQPHRLRAARLGHLRGPGVPVRHRSPPRTGGWRAGRRRSRSRQGGRQEVAGTVTLLTPKDRLRRDADRNCPACSPRRRRLSTSSTRSTQRCTSPRWTGCRPRSGSSTGTATRRTPRSSRLLQGLVNAIPRTKVKGSWVVPEAGLPRHPVHAVLRGRDAA